MAIEKSALNIPSTVPTFLNGIAQPVAAAPQLAKLDASRLKFTPTTEPKHIPSSDELVFGKWTTDHMLVITFDPLSGWSDPHIKPYAPLQLDPMSSCFQYATNVFEGMKAYLGPDGKARLFRPEKNMERLLRSSARVALPPFDPEALLECLKRLVSVDQKWIPNFPESSLYIRPTIIGTRAALGVVASDSCMIYIIMSPSGPLFRSSGAPAANQATPTLVRSISTLRSKSISLLAVSSHVRAWPGGTGSFKLSGNYSPGFQPQAIAKEAGYEQVLWLLEDNSQAAKGGREWRITEAGAMNFFLLLKGSEGEVEVLTPPLDGTILPGITRSSILDLAASHSPETPLPGLSPTLKIRTYEKTMTLSDLKRWYDEGRLLEAWAVGTAIVMVPVGKIGIQRTDDNGVAPVQKTSDIGHGGVHEKVLILPDYEDENSVMGPVGRAVKERLVAIQEGRYEWKDWSVICQ